MQKVCHITSAHDWNDDRIYLKECQSLAAAGYKVYLSAEGIDREENGVHVVGCGDKPASRRERMKGFARHVYERAQALDCDIYHFHDPELLPYGLKLKKQGKKVIFDSHEDVSGQILDKEWIPYLFRKIISVCYKQYETYCVRQFDAVVTATPHIAELFESRCNKVIVINNYPKLDDIKFHDTPFNQRDRSVCYAGGISEIRGEKIMVGAMAGIDGELLLAGPYDESSRVEYQQSNVKYLGKISRSEVNELFGRSRGGIVLYQPAENHFASQPIKMFEYMAAGLPVIASDFPHWQNIVKKTECGICVDPTNVDAVREACIKILSDPESAQQMGRNGYKNVMQGYNWKVEEKKLLKLYEEL